MHLVPLRSLALAAALCLSSGLPGGAAAAEITVFAAASLKTALDAFAAEWQAETGTTVTVSYAASSALSRQIEQGAPADLFISAATDWMDVLDTAGLLKPDTRRDLFGNTLVLVAHGRDAPPVEIGPGLDLPALLAGGKLSMAMVDSVPAGQYGKEALQSLGLWTAVEGSVAQAENVRVALTFVASGEAPLGIVYASDAIAGAAAGDAVTVIGRFPESSHRPIVYPAAVIADSTAPEAAAFLDALSSDRARRIFTDQGFVLLDR